MAKLNELADDVKYYVEIQSSAEISSEKIIDNYNKWATRYDEDIISSKLFLGPCLTANQLNEVCKENKKVVKILDVGAGTGAVGKLCQSFGFENIDALEPSENMLNEARKIGCYKEYYQEFMGKSRLQIDDNTYDYVITSGTMLPGHCNEECFEEIIRILKPGGLFILSMWDKYSTIATDWTKRFFSRMEELEKQGKWTIVKKVLNQEYVNGSEYKGTVFVIQNK